MGNFDYKKYLVENKLTLNSRLNENENTLQWPDAIRNFITTNLSSDEKELYLVVKALEKTLESFKNEMGGFDPDFHYTNEDIDSTSENKLTSNSNLNEEATDKFYVSFKYSSGMGGTFKNLPRHINDTYQGALSSIRTLKGYDEDRELATGEKFDIEYFVSDKDGNPIDEDGNTIK